MMTMKKSAKWMSILSAAFVLAACGAEDDNGTADDNGDDTEEIIEDENGDDTEVDEADEEDDADADDADAGDSLEGAANVVTREHGSGTRGAFEDIFGIEEGVLDQFTVQQGTNAVMTNVADDESAIGYTSVGSLNDTVKAIAVDGVEATGENIQSGEYEVYRPFNIAYGSELSEAAQAFWDWIFTEEAQAIVEEEGYVPVETTDYELDESISGEVVVGGSTSVYPVIEVLAEEFSSLTDVTFDLQSAGSGAGMTGAIEGDYDIGMASREVADEEAADLAGYEAMALDGIAIIVHPDNPIEDISFDTVTGVFTGEVTDWSEIQ